MVVEDFLLLADTKRYSLGKYQVRAPLFSCGAWIRKNCEKSNYTRSSFFFVHPLDVSCLVPPARIHKIIADFPCSSRRLCLSTVGSCTDRMKYSIDEDSPSNWDRPDEVYEILSKPTRHWAARASLGREATMMLD